MTVLQAFLGFFNVLDTCEEDHFLKVSSDVEFETTRMNWLWHLLTNDLGQGTLPGDLSKMERQ